MNIEKIFIKRVAQEDDFNYKALYNDSLGAVFKDECKSFIRQAISKNVLTVEKFIIAENIQKQLYQISETKGFEYTLIRLLKIYHNESDSLISPLIYILKKLDPDFKITTNEGDLKIVSDLFEVQIRPRIDKKNAKPRMFFPKEKIAITSTNDDVENLFDILAVKGVKVYIIGTDDRSNVIYAYKIKRKERYFHVAESYKEDIGSMAELFNNFKKI